uniref:Uncharacterized protein n=1 Tax=Avena sativa TaxID=4498 RepID=A0ACD5WLX6_AVESA
MAHAAVPLRRPLLLFLRPTRLLSSLAPPSSRRAHTRGTLRPVAPLPSDGEDSGDADAASFGRSRNEKKREARRAVQWGMELAKFSTPQIKRILRAARLESEVLEALMLVKKFGPDVREGRRRQYNYIGSLLRSVQPELMETLIQSSKDGDDSRLQALLSEVEDKSMPEEDEEVEELPNEEGDEEYIEIADRWFEGLVCKDIPVTNEVYAIHDVEFDRQELRKLVRIVQVVQEESIQNKDRAKGSDVKLTRAKKPLLMFLRSLAKKHAE